MKCLFGNCIESGFNFHFQLIQLELLIIVINSIVLLLCFGIDFMELIESFVDFIECFITGQDACALVFQ